jgi:putative tricarboxylic transport membrane protein
MLNRICGRVREVLLTLGMTMALGAAMLHGVAAQDFPKKPVTLVVGTSAGGPQDTSMRRLASLLERDLGQPVVVENRPGGNGAVAMAFVRSQPADGYTLISASSALEFAIAKNELPFKLGDFHLLRMIESEAYSVAVRGDSPFKTLDDFVRRMREDPRGVRVGGYASSGFGQYLYYQIQKAGRFKGTWIPFDSGREVTVALLGGHIDVAFSTTSGVLPQFESGDIRLLGIATYERSEHYPNVPTIKEQGYNVEKVVLWRGLLMRAGAPAHVVARLQKAIDAAIASVEWKRKLAESRQDPENRREEHFEQVVVRTVNEARQFLKEAGYVK